VERVYRDFVGRAAAARNVTPERMDELAQGRVWTGRRAHELQLVDRLATFHEALQVAAKRGGLGEDFRVTYVESEPRGIDRVLGILFGEASLAALFVAPLRGDDARCRSIDRGRHALAAQRFADAARAPIALPVLA
jgi:ClpP class serine protease